MTDTEKIEQAVDGPCMSLDSSSGSAQEVDSSENSNPTQQLALDGSIDSAATASVEEQHSLHSNMDSSLPQIYRSEYPVTQINGCRQYGPPKTWTGKIPGFGCEIYVKRIPPEFTEAELVPLFERFGKLYEMRLMMDYNNQNRRYCFVRYASEEEAKVAIEVLNHHFVRDSQTLEAQKSFEKCRLFVGNLPKDLDRKTIEIAFRSLFPEMTRFVMHNRIADSDNNRGFAFMDFADHGAALRAKKQTTPGCMRIWERDIKIVWANPQRSLDHSGVDEVRTLFVRNIDQTVNTKDLYNLLVRLVPRQDIIKISRVREFAFVEFAQRQQAELVMHAVQGYVMNNFSLDIEWALPPLRFLFNVPELSACAELVLYHMMYAQVPLNFRIDSNRIAALTRRITLRPTYRNTFHNMKNYDFDSLLRIKCIANGWDLPIIIYGRTFTMSCVQYVAVIIRYNAQVYVYFAEIHMAGLVDIQSRVCEAMISLILEGGVLPEQYLVLKVKHDSMKLVGSVSSLDQPILKLARDVDRSLELFWNEIVDLCAAANVLSKYSFDDLYILYRREIETGVPFPYLESISLKDRIIGCLDQSFRHRPTLSHKLDNRQIILVLCDQYTLTNYNFTKKNSYIAETVSSIKDSCTSTLQYKVFPMLPSRFVQANGGREFKIEAVYFGLNPYSAIDTKSVNTGYAYPQLLPFHPPNIQSQPIEQPPTQAMFNSIVAAPAAPPTSYYGDVNFMTQPMHQMGLGSGPLPMHALYGQQVPPPGPPFFYNM